MSSDQRYRCLSCLDHTVTREFDVSHLSVTCENCGEFGRFVHERVYQEFQALEESPPEELDWDRLDRLEKFYVAERLVRSDTTIEDFELTDHTEE